MINYINNKYSSSLIIIKQAEDIDKISNLRHKLIMFKCTNCGKIYLSNWFTNSIKDRNRLKMLLCTECAREQTMLTVYGVRNVGESKEFHEKAWETNIKNTGHKIINCIGTDEFKQNMLKIHGVDNPMKDPKIKEKVKLTNLERRGVEIPNCIGTDEFKQNMLKTHGVDNAMKDPNIAKHNGNVRKNLPKENKIKSTEKRRQTTTKTKGKPDWMQFGTPEFMKYILSKFGVDNYTKTDEYKEKYLYIMTHLHYRMYFYGVKFDSSWELAVWIYCIDHNISIQRDPCVLKYVDCYGKTKQYYPDFMINGKLVEIKGDHFFKEDGSMRFPYDRLHHDSNPMTFEEKEYMNDLYERKQRCAVDNGVEFWRKEDCQPYIDYCNSMYPGWNVRFRKNNPLNPSYWCFSIPNPGYFQPQYYQPLSEKDKGITPYEMTTDDYQFVSDTKITPFDKGVLYGTPF